MMMELKHLMGRMMVVGLMKLKLKPKLMVMMVEQLMELDSYQLD
jgi:hypothetical protein